MHHQRIGERDGVANGQSHFCRLSRNSTVRSDRGNECRRDWRPADRRTCRRRPDVRNGIGPGRRPWFRPRERSGRRSSPATPPRRRRPASGRRRGRPRLRRRRRPRAERRSAPNRPETSAVRTWLWVLVSAVPPRSGVAIVGVGRPATTRSRRWTRRRRTTASAHRRLAGYRRRMDAAKPVCARRSPRERRTRRGSQRPRSTGRGDRGRPNCARKIR